MTALDLYVLVFLPVVFVSLCVVPVVLALHTVKRNAGPIPGQRGPSRRVEAHG